MELIIKKTAADIAKDVARHFVHFVEQNPKANLGLATGSSPLDIYKHIIYLHEKRRVSFAQVKTFNLDEYLGLVDDKQSYRFFMQQNLFNHLDIPLENTHFPDATKPEGYDALIAHNGGVDIQLLGIGSNGHIAFNEPFTSFSSYTHIVNLDEKTRKDNARFFRDMNEVPTQAVTMGLATIMQAREIILVILGDAKILALKQLFCMEKDESFPASILNEHPNVKVYTTMDLFKKTFCHKA